jgi:hypothetical protein
VTPGEFQLALIDGGAAAMEEMMAHLRARRARGGGSVGPAGTPGGRSPFRRDHPGAGGPASKLLQEGGQERVALQHIQRICGGSLATAANP